jgi:hypothetical protein
MQLAPLHGHLINGSESVPKLEDIIGNLAGRGYVIEAEAKLAVTIEGKRTRATIKVKPQESLLVKLKLLSAAAVPILRMFVS